MSRPQGPVRHFIREWRLHRGMSLDRLGELAGVTGSLLSQLERGKAGYVQTTLARIAKALRVEPWMLVAAPPGDLGLTVFRDKLQRLSLDLDEEAAKQLLAFFERYPQTAGYLLAVAAQESARATT